MNRITNYLFNTPHLNIYFAQPMHPVIDLVNKTWTLLYLSEVFLIETSVCLYISFFFVYVNPFIWLLHLH